MNGLDEKLVNKVKNGDISSFEKLVFSYQKKIYSFIFRMVLSVEDARDLTQEVFIQAFRSLDQFRGDSKFSTWIYRIAANKSLDFLRRNKRYKFTVVNDLDVGELSSKYSTKDNPEHTYLREEKIRRIRDIITGLPEKYMVVVILFHYEKLSYQQVADTLDIPVKTVATRLYRAKLILKEAFGGETDGML